MSGRAGGIGTSGPVAGGGGPVAGPAAGPGAGRFAGRTALVTGAATGIGEAVAQRLAAEGARVVLAGLQPEALARVATRVGGHALPLDVADEGQARAVVARALEIGAGRLEVLVNAAGWTTADDVAELDDDTWQRMLDVNLGGTMRLCRAVLPAMRAQGGGAIVNVASVAAFNASAGMASYATSKSGVVALTRAIANRYGADGVRANCVCPGWVRTPMSEAEMREAAVANGTTMEAEFAALTKRIALARIGRADEIAACVAFLASDDASFVTGAALVADGGAKVPATARAV